MSGFDSYSTLLEQLTSVFGENNVLTNPEDIYVYSHTGEFGIYKKYNPLAVIRINSDTDTNTLEKLTKNLGLQIIWNDRKSAQSPSFNDPSIIVDNRKPIDIKDLIEILSVKRAEINTLKTQAKKAKSIHQRLTLSLQTIDGYRLNDDPKSDSGFCIVQPFFDGVETYSAKGRLLLSKGLLKRELEPSNRMTDSIYNCTACGQCYDQLSDSVLEINNAILKSRHELVKQGYSPKQCMRLIENLSRENNPMGMSIEDRTLWIEDIASEFNYKENPVLYWPGCNSAYRLPEIIKSTSRILVESDTDFGLLGEKEGCCGLPLYLFGYWNEARKIAEKLIASFDSNLKTLVTSCAGCYYAFSKVFPSLGVEPSFNVLHSSQFIMQALKTGRIRVGSADGNYVWHDPCDLGRHCSVYEAPRFVLSSIEGLNLVEPPLHRQHTTCCGAGGGLWMYNPELTEKVSHKKMKDIVPLDIDGIITGCPACILNIRTTAREFRPGLKVLDISEIVSKYL